MRMGHYQRHQARALTLAQTLSQRQKRMLRMPLTHRATPSSLLLAIAKHSMAPMLTFPITPTLDSQVVVFSTLSLISQPNLVLFLKTSNGFWILDESMLLCHCKAPTTIPGMIQDGMSILLHLSRPGGRLPTVKLGSPIMFMAGITLTGMAPKTI